MKAFYLNCICYLATCLSGTCSPVGVSGQPLAESSTSVRNTGLANDDSQAADAACVASISSPRFLSSAVPDTAAARQHSLPLTLAIIILHCNVCPIDYTEAIALAAFPAFPTGVHLKRHNTLNKTLYQQLTSAPRRRPDTALRSLGLCLPTDKPNPLTSKSTAASGDASMHSTLPVAGKLTRYGTDISPVQTDMQTSSVEQASLLQHTVHLLWAKQEFPVTIYLWAAIVATFSMFLGWLTYRMLRIKKCVSFSQKQSKTQDSLPNDAAVKEKQAAAGAAAGLSKQSSGSSTKVYSPPTTTDETTAFMQHSSPSSPSRRFTGAISIDQKQARNLAEEAATVNSSSPATTKTSKASPLDAVQEVYDPVSNADSIFQQKAYKAGSSSVKKRSSAALHSNATGTGAAVSVVADSSMGNTHASAQQPNQSDVVCSNQTPLLQQATVGVDFANRPARRRKASVLLPSAQQAAAEERGVAAVQEPAVGRSAENTHAQDLNSPQGIASTTSDPEAVFIPKHMIPTARVQEVPGCGVQQPSFTTPVTCVTQQPSFTTSVTSVTQDSTFITPPIHQRVPTAISQPLGSSRQNQVFGSFSSMGDSDVVIRVDAGTDAAVDGAGRRGALGADKDMKKNKKKSKWYKKLLCCAKPAVK